MWGFYKNKPYQSILERPSIIANINNERVINNRRSRHFRGHCIAINDHDQCQVPSAAANQDRHICVKLQ